MTSAAVYCRVSTDSQEREGTSLKTQLEHCLKYCHDKGYDATYQFSETYSGLSLERTELDNLRELIRNERVDIVVCYSLDRLSRDPGHGVIITQEMEKHNVKLETVTEDVDNSELGKLISYIRGYASKVEAQRYASAQCAVNWLVPRKDGYRAEVGLLFTVMITLGYHKRTAAGVS